MNNVPLDYALARLTALKIIKLNERLYSLNITDSFVEEMVKEVKDKFGNLPLKVQFEIFDFMHLTLRIDGISSLILFGSYAKLIYSDKSDIDIAVVFENVIELGDEKKIEKIAEKISKEFRKEIQVHFFKGKDMKHKEDPLIKDILKNRRVLV